MQVHPESDCASCSGAGSLASEWDMGKALSVTMTTGGTGAVQSLEWSCDDVFCTQPEAHLKTRLVSPAVWLKYSGALGDWLLIGKGVQHPLYWKHLGSVSYLLFSCGHPKSSEGLLLSFQSMSYTAPSRPYPQGKSLD